MPDYLFVCDNPQCPVQSFDHYQSMLDDSPIACECDECKRPAQRVYTVPQIAESRGTQGIDTRDAVRKGINNIGSMEMGRHDNQVMREFCEEKFRKKIEAKQNGTNFGDMKIGGLPVNAVPYKKPKTRDRSDIDRTMKAVKDGIALADAGKTMVEASSLPK